MIDKRGQQHMVETGLDHVAAWQVAHLNHEKSINLRRSQSIKDSLASPPITSAWSGSNRG